MSSARLRSHSLLLERTELANLATDSLGEVMAAAHRGIGRIRSAWWLPYAFARRCGICFC
jgi:hypothetical protein